MPALEGPALRRSLRLSVAEGSVWALMVGFAESYVIAIGVFLGASPVQIALLVALPLALGACGPVASLVLLGRRRARRPLAVAMAAVQVALLATLAGLLWLGALDLPLLITAVCVYQMAGQGAGIAWSSWYGDLVPAATRGRWFSFRNRFIYLATCAGLVAGGVIMQRLAPGGTDAQDSATAFAVLLALAAVCRLASCVLLLMSPEPQFRGLLPGRRVVKAARTRQGGQALRVLLVGSLLHFTVYWSSPYFAPFMLSELQFDYLQYMAASLVAIVAKMAASLPWGRAIDRRGARGVYLVCLVCVALIPLPWVWASGLVAVVLAQLLSGIAWSGQEVGYLSLLLDNSRSSERPYLFTLQSLGHGWMQLAGALTASLLILPQVEGFRSVFAISAGGRLLVALGAPLLLAGVGRGARTTLSQTGLRVFGLRPHGGFSVRPVLPSGEREDPRRDGADDHR